MEDSGLWDQLRSMGIDADDPQIRAIVRTCLAGVEEVRQRHGLPAARRSMQAIHAAMSHELQHPGTDDMSRFEDQFGDE